MEVVNQFMAQLRDSLEKGVFVKLTLSKASAQAEDLRNVYARLIDLRGQSSLSFILRYPTRDETKNHLIPDALALISAWLGHSFLQADLFTLTEDVSLQFNKKREARISKRRASHQQAPSNQHDKEKVRPLDASQGAYLHHLGITNAEGQILKDGQKKFRQISKYIEIIDSLLRQHPLPMDAHIVDMGSGKGYLTFALYDYLTNKLGLRVWITGIELRPQLVEFCNQVARQCNMDRLSFVAQDIREFQPERLDMLIALHACDTATDEALAKGIGAAASILVVAPCCHKQIRKQMHCETDMQSILKHGILEERQAELITDGIRSLILEAKGYSTKVFEFISTEHTSKNLMITGVKGQVQADAWEQVAAIKKNYGIEYHQLERLLMH